MAPPKKAPDGLVDLIKKAISEAFPLLPVDIAKKVKVCVSKLDGIDYQFFIRHIADYSCLEPNDVTEKILEKVAENNLIKSLTVHIYKWVIHQHFHQNSNQM